MHTRSIIAAALVAACLLATGLAVADDVETVVVPAAGANTASTTDQEAPKAMAEEQSMKKTAAPGAGVHLTTGRPRADGRRDARACLNQANNPAIIKCAEKYRYR